jgi:hypothetical protein
MKAKICNVCNLRTIGTKGSDPMSARIAGLCGLCMDEGGWENTHNDSDHDTILESLEDVEYGKTNHKSEAEYLAWKKAQENEIDGCWICYPALNEAANWKPGKAKNTPASKATYVRRTQLNHKGHGHPQTPKARRECKEAFWAWAASTDGPKDLTEEHFAAWGMPVVKPAPAKLHVLPLGPKGGVINQLKKGSPAK